jgi:hypothetical protein
MPDGLWEAVLADPRAAGRSPLPILQYRLSDAPSVVFHFQLLKDYVTVDEFGRNAYGTRPLTETRGSLPGPQI